jgi:hypothetical protein
MPIATAVTSAPAACGRDTRIDAVVSLLGEFMPSDPSSPVAPYVSGFMSLRLLLLRPSRTIDEDELTRTILDSFSSYTAGGRARADIAVMLARDYMFLGQQQQQQPHYGCQSRGMMSSETPIPSAATEAIRQATSIATEAAIRQANSMHNEAIRQATEAHVKTATVQIPDNVERPERQQCDVGVQPLVDLFSPHGLSLYGGSEVSTRPDTLTELSGEDSVLTTGYRASTNTTISGQSSKRSVDEIGPAIDEHEHNGKASKAFAADSPEHSDPVEKLAELHSPWRLELRNLPKDWDLARLEGSHPPTSGHFIFRGPQGKIPLL